MQNKIAKNRISPKNENEMINVYKSQNPKAKKSDGLDVAAVVTKDGIKGHALMKPEHNRSHDKEFHRVKDFISDEELNKNKNSKI